MKTNFKPISPWGSINSMLGAKIRADNLRKMIQRSMVYQMSDVRRRYDMESELVDLISRLGDIIDYVQAAAINQYAKARPLLSKGGNGEKTSSNDKL